MEKAIKRYWPVFVLPTLIAFIIGFVWPFIWGTGLSFCKFTTVKNVQFAGLSNYKMILMDDTFTHAFWFTAAFTVVSTVLVNVLAFAIALLLTRGMRGTNAFRTIFFLPNLIGGIVLGLHLADPAQRPAVRLGQVAAGVERHLRLLGPYRPDVLAADRLHDDHLHRLTYRTCPPTSSRPHASTVRPPARFSLKSKVPMVMPSVTICTFLTLTNSFKLFDQNLSLTAGEPAKQSMMLAYNIYDTFYARSGPQWKGIGQAKAVVFFLFVVVISLLQLHFTRSKEVQA